MLPPSFMTLTHITNIALTYCAEITNGIMKVDGSKDKGIFTVSISLIFMLCSHPCSVYRADHRRQGLTEELVHAEQYLHGAVQRRQHQPRQTATEIWQAVTLLQTSLKSPDASQ